MLPLELETVRRGKHLGKFEVIFWCDSPILQEGLVDMSEWSTEFEGDEVDTPWFSSVLHGEVMTQLEEFWVGSGHDAKP